MEGKDEKSSYQLDINLTFGVFFLGYFCTVKRKKRQRIMDVITIESGLWQELTNRIKKIERYVEESTKLVTYEDDELWVDNSQAIRLLCVSGRTLQQYRSDGKLAYKRFGKMVWYRLSDIEAFAGITMRPLSQRNLIAIRRECIEKNRDIMLHMED